MIVYVYYLFHPDNIFDDRICYTKKYGVARILQFSQQNDKLLLPQWKQGNYPVIPIYAPQRVAPISGKHYIYQGT